VPITLVTGPANAGKAQVVLGALRGHVAHGEEPLLVVPTEADQARYRRELAAGGLTLGVRVERFEGLLGEVLARAALTQAPLGALARERVLARLADARPGMAGALAKFVAELETQRVTPSRLREALAGWSSEAQTPNGGQATLERLCTVFERYHEALAKMRRCDRELRLTGALDELRRSPAKWGATPVLFYGFDDLTELELDAIETLAGVVGTKVTVSLSYEPGRVVFAGRAGAFGRLAPLAEEHRELQARAEHYAPTSRQALHHLERSLLTEESRRVPPGDAIRLLEGGSPRAELELVAGEVRAQLDLGVQATEIAIVHRRPEAIAELLGEVLEDFDVPYALRASVGFAHTAIGRGLLGLLRCAVGEGSLSDLLAWLRAPGALEQAALADRLEVEARRRGAVGCEQARALWEAEHWPLERIDRMSEMTERGTAVLADALVKELQRLFSGPRRGVAAVLGEDELDEARALASGSRALEELRELARAAPELAPVPTELIDVLERLEFHGGERRTAPAVAIVDPMSLRARRVRMVFACGMQEGVFPAPAIAQSLLGEEDRRRLALASGLVLRGEPDSLAAERYLLYALVSRPEERLTLSWHTADDDGRPLARSLFLDDVCELFGASLEEQTIRRLAGAAGWPGPGAPAGPMALRTASWNPHAARTRSVARPIAPLRDERVLGDLRERVLWSASSLESWAGCPVKWFVERLLRADEIEPDPEPLARGALAHEALKDTVAGLRERVGSGRLTPVNLGLARKLLRQALEEHSERFPLSVAAERVPGARRRLQVELERYIEHASQSESPLEPTHLELEFGFAEGQSPAGQATGAQGDAVDDRDTQGDSVDDRDTQGDSVDDRGAEGDAVDDRGRDSGGRLAALALGEGVLLRGRIDRVDLSATGEAVVYDYKGRLAPAGAKWVGENTFQMALYMRAVEQLLGNRAIGGFYQPLAGKELRARGAFDCESGVELDCVRTDRYPHEGFQELIEQCVGAALQAAKQARAGALEPRPDTCAYNGGCAYPTICRCEP
jgi:ATP-dependent helicase/DNAse subunit B